MGKTACTLPHSFPRSTALIFIFKQSSSAKWVQNRETVHSKCHEITCAMAQITFGIGVYDFTCIMSKSHVQLHLQKNPLRLLQSLLQISVCLWTSFGKRMLQANTNSCFNIQPTIGTKSIQCELAISLQKCIDFSCFVSTYRLSFTAALLKAWLSVVFLLYFHNVAEGLVKGRSGY